MTDGLRPSQLPATPIARRKPQPVRNLIAGVAFTVAVMLAATLSYMAVGWSFRDALFSSA